MLILAVGGGVALLGLVALLVWVIGFGAKVPGVGSVAKSAPAGYTDVRDTEAGFRVFLPGKIEKVQFIRTPQLPAGFEKSQFMGSDATISSRTNATRTSHDFKPGSLPEQLFELLTKHGGSDAWNIVVSKTSITLGGRPALEVRMREKKFGEDDTPLRASASEWAKKVDEKMRAERKKSQEDWEKEHGKEPIQHYIFLVTTDGKRVIVLQLEQKDAFPDDATLKVVTDSFEFL